MKRYQAMAASDAAVLDAQIEIDMPTKGVQVMAEKAWMTRTTTAEVTAYLETLGFDVEWTTCDIAEALQVKEYGVRAAITWLQVRKRVIRTGTTRRYTNGTNCPYTATTYRLVEIGGPADFKVLNRAFGYGG
jgi:hypothetical protein